MVDGVSNYIKHILICEPVDSRRVTMREVLREFKIPEVSTVATIKEVIANLNSENAPDLILSSFIIEKDINSFALLPSQRRSPKQKPYNLALFIDKNQEKYLEKAYEHGLTSHHPMNFSKQTLMDELNQLFSHTQKYRGNYTLVAASYLRRLLKSSGKVASLLKLEEALLSAFPKVPETILNLAEAQIQSGLIDDAIVALKQASLMGGLLKLKAEAIAKNQLKVASIDKLEVSRDSSRIEIGTCLVVDPDDDVNNSVTSIMKEIGASKVYNFPNGEAAYNFCKDLKEKPELIIQEWRLPKISGPNFLQRVKTLFPEASVVVNSSLVQDRDLVLLREMGVNTIIQKPFDKSRFQEEIVAAIFSEKYPSGVKEIASKIEKLLDAQNIEEAQKLRGLLFSIPDIDPFTEKKIDAKYNFASENYKAAKELGLAALHLTKEFPLSLVNLLSHCFLKLEEYETALKFMEKAQLASPTNIERLCNIAKARCELGDEAESTEAIKKAQSIDPTSPVVQKTAAEVATSFGRVDEAKKILTQMDSINSVVAYMNNRAVILARSGKIKESIEMYQKTIQAIPDHQKNIKYSVTFNLGFAFYRQSKIEEAISVFASIPPDSPNYEKCTDIRGKLDKMKKSGKIILPPQFKDKSDAKEIETIQMAKDVGKYALFGIFSSDDEQIDINNLFKKSS